MMVKPFSPRRNLHPRGSEPLHASRPCVRERTRGTCQAAFFLPDLLLTSGERGSLGTMLPRRGPASGAIGSGEAHSTVISLLRRNLGGAPASSRARAALTTDRSNLENQAASCLSAGWR